MDLLSNSTVKTPDAETETPTPTRIQPVRTPAFTNGVLKRHAPLHLHHPVVVTYKECLKNHAAALGGHALDGCGEFMPSPASNPADPTSLTCAACGCHRNFHRREPEEPMAPAIEYLSHRRHHPPPPPPPPQPHTSGGSSPNNSPSPPPISSSYYPSAPHMLMALSHGGVPAPPPPDGGAMNSNSHSRKRFRSKFTQFQKDKMLEFAEKLGWKMQKKDEDLINDFCAEIGVEKGVLKVWMHNNKTTFAKKDHQIAIANPPESGANGGGNTYPAAAAASEENDEIKDNSILGTTNGSSSS